MISVQREDFDPGREIAALSGQTGQSGAVATFIGLVRGDNELDAMTLEHYPGMTERQLSAIEAQARDRWPLDDVRVIHRYGRLMPGERIVFVGVTSSHRDAAFAACEFLMDWLKTKAPFWKMEETAQGPRWVDAKDSDDLRAARWSDQE